MRKRLFQLPSLQRKSVLILLILLVHTQWKRVKRTEVILYTTDKELPSGNNGLQFLPDDKFWICVQSVTVFRFRNCCIILIFDFAQKLIAINKLRFTEVRDSSLTSVHFEIIITRNNRQFLPVTWPWI